MYVVVHEESHEGRGAAIEIVLIAIVLDMNVGLHLLY
jgi:hypothetical protein